MPTTEATLAILAHRHVVECRRLFERVERISPHLTMLEQARVLEALHEINESLIALCDDLLGRRAMRVH